MKFISDLICDEAIHADDNSSQAVCTDGFSWSGPSTRNRLLTEFAGHVSVDQTFALLVLDLQLLTRCVCKLQTCLPGMPDAKPHAHASV